MTENVKQFQSVLVEWFSRSQRALPWRETRDPYHIWISEVMLQQTQVATVIPYYQRFIEAFPTLKILAEASEETVLKCWEGLGYYARARNLHQAARFVEAHLNGEVPRDLQAFRALKGVGEYIAAAVSSIAFDTPVAVVDGNVKRVLARLSRVAFPVNHAAAHREFKPFAEALLDESSPGLFNQAMMELGALICTPKRPRCTDCPVARFCESNRHEEVDAYPKREKKRPVPTHRIAVGVIWKADRVLITKRKPDGLLGGLWEFPGGKVEQGESSEDACLREIREEVGLSVSIRRHLAEVRHAYTHFKIEMDVFDCLYRSGEVVLNGPVDFEWSSLDGLRDRPFPKANNKFIPLLESRKKKKSL